MRVLLLLVLMCCSLLTGTAFAACSVVSRPSFGSPAISYYAGRGNDIIPGTPVGSWINSSAYGSNLAFRCSTTLNGGGYWRYNVSLNTLMNNYVDVEDGLVYTVYQTGTPGVGIIIRYQVANNVPVAMTGAGFQNSAIFPVIANAIIPVYLSIKYIIVNKTSLMTGTTLVPNISLFSAADNGLYSKTSVEQTSGGTLSNTGGMTLSVSSSSCQLQNTYITLALPSVVTTDLLQENTINYPVQNLILNNCPQGVNVWITLTDSLDPSNTSNILTANSNDPSGIGIQILINGQLVNFGPPPGYRTTLTQYSSIQVVSGSAGGTETIPMSAKYVLTGDPISPGMFNKQAYINFSYP